MTLNGMPVALVAMVQASMARCSGARSKLPTTLKDSRTLTPSRMSELAISALAALVALR